MGNASGSVSCSSDKRLKKNIEPLTGVLDKIRQIKGVSFDWKDGRNGSRKDVGVIAQDVEKVFPSLVHEDSKGFKTVDYGSLVSPLIEAVKALYAQWMTHDSKIQALRAENAAKDLEIKRVELA